MALPRDVRRLRLAQWISADWQWLVARGFLGACLSYCTACSDPAPNAGLGDFEAATDDFEGGLLLSVTEIDGQPWAVGGRPGQTAILRGDDLEPVDNPGESTAWWVCELGDGIAVVGEDGLILTYSEGDGFDRVDLGVITTFYGCSGSSVDDFWVVGGDPKNGPPELIRTRDGRAPDLGELVAELPNVLFKIEVIEEQLFVVGEEGVILVRDDGDWSLTRLQPEPLFTVSGNSADDVWVVGGRNRGLAYHFDGERWAEDSPPGAPGLFGVSVAGERVLTVGHRGAMFERKGSDDESQWVELDRKTQRVLHASWQDEDGHAWAVGGNVLETSPQQWRGVVLRR